MTARKICVVITARPSYSRVRTALRAIVESPDLELQLVVAGPVLLDRYGSAVHHIEDDGFPIAARVFTVLEGENLTSMAKTAGLGVLELATIFEGLQPDAVVTVADRFETMSTAIAATYMNIPLVHLLGGEVTGNIDEKVRHAVTKLADLHFVATRLAADRVIRMGERRGAVHVTGCPSVDLAVELPDTDHLSFDPFERYAGVGASIDLGEGYLVVMQHPVTTEYALARDHIEETLEAVAAVGLPTLWFWPNVDAGSDGTSKGIRAYRETHELPHVHFFKNLEPVDFLEVLRAAKALVGNSSVGLREGSYLGVPVVNVGSRQSGRERGPNVVDVGYDRHEIAAGIRAQVAHGRYPSDPTYGDGKAGQRIADLLAKADLTFEKRLAY